MLSEQISQPNSLGWKFILMCEIKQKRDNRKRNGRKIQRLTRCNKLREQLLGTSNKQVTFSEAASTAVIRDGQGCC